MRILADTNVPEEYVFALRGDGHQVEYSRDVTQLGPEPPDDEITEYAEANDFSVLSTDVKDFGGPRGRDSDTRCPAEYDGRVRPVGGCPSGGVTAGCVRVGATVAHGVGIDSPSIIRGSNVELVASTCHA